MSRVFSKVVGLFIKKMSSGTRQRAGEGAGYVVEGRSGFIYSNWAKSYECRPELYFEPKNLSELRQILARARVEQKHVKVVGFGHSGSDIACTEGYMISLKHFNKVLHIDQDAKIFKAEAGILFSDLVPILYEKHLALSVLSAISNLTLGGAIATGTHSSGLKYGALHTYIVELELLCADGSLMTLSRDRDEDLFLAGCLNLGALGVVISVTMTCEDAYNLSCVQYPLSLSDFCEQFMVHVNSSDHFRCFVFPHTDKCQIQHINRTNKDIIKGKSSWFWNRFVGVYLLEFFFWLGSFFPGIIPWVNSTYFKMLFTERQERVDRYDKVFNFDCLIPFYVMEWAVPLENTAVALYELNAWISNNFSTQFPMEVRFCKADDIILSPAYQVDICYINVLVHRPYYKSMPRDELWSALKTIVMKHGGRPHWGKDHGLTRDQLERMYPRWKKFVELRKRLDPSRMFINEYLDRIF